MRNWKRVAGLLLATLALPGCSLFSGEEDVVKMAPLPKVESRFQAETLWSRSVGGGVGKFFSRMSPVIDGEHIFAAARDGKVQAFNKQSGERLWSRDLSDLPVNEVRRSPRLASLSAAYGNLYVGSENGHVYALSQENGDLVWQADVPGEVVAAPAVEAGKLVVLTTAGRLVALDADTGEFLWGASDEQPNLTLRGMSQPVIVSGGVLYGLADGKLAIVLLENGQLVNVAKVSSPRGLTELERMVDVDAMPVVQGDELYMIAYNGQLVARKLISGEELWKRKYSSYQDISIGGQDLVLTDERSYLYAVDRSNGREKWSNTQLAYRNLTAPLALGELVVVGDSEGYLYWLDQADGRIVSMQRLDSDGLYVAPLVDGDMLYVQTRGGDLVALKRP